MTLEQAETSTEIIRRLLKKDFACENYRGELKAMTELAEEVAEAWTRGNYETFLAAAKKLNAIYKKLSGDDAIDREGWEH